MSQQFKVGDKVKFGDAEGVVKRVDVDRITYPIMVSFEGNGIGTELAFTENGKLYFSQPKGFPSLTLVSRPERFVEKEVYQPVIATEHGRYYKGDRLYNTKEQCLIHGGNTIGYAVSKVFIKESEG